MAFMAVLAIAGLVASQRQASKTRDEQREQQAIGRAQENVADLASRRAAFREQRVRQANILQASANQGVFGSSGQLSALSSLQSNISGQVASQAGQANTADALTASAQRAANYGNQSQLYGQIGNFAFQSALNRGQFDGLLGGGPTT